MTPAAIAMMIGFYAIGAIAFGAIGWCATRLVRRIDLAWLRHGVFGLACLSPLWLPVVLTLVLGGPISGWAQGAKSVVVLMALAPLLLPAGVGAALGRR